MPAAADAPATAFELKGEMTTLCVLHLLQCDMEALARGLKDKVRQAPGFFHNTPVCIDLHGLADSHEALDFEGLKSILYRYGLRPVGVRNANASVTQAAELSGLAVLRGRPARTTPEESTDRGRDKEDPDISALIVDRPVRSGQQVYAQGRDLVLLALASAGSELLADGSIHVYGPLRGRALAGVKGNRTARIFCQSLEAELVSIAGQYQVIEQLASELSGKPAQVRLNGNQLAITPL